MYSYAAAELMTSMDVVQSAGGLRVGGMFVAGLVVANGRLAEGEGGVAVEPRGGRTIAAILLGRASYSSRGEAEATFSDSPTTCVVVSYTVCLLNHCKVCCSATSRMAAEPTLPSVLRSERTGFCY